MEYDNVKLGLIGKLKVWSARKDAEKYKAYLDRTEHEITGVDYSKADELESELLNKKKIKKATKDASKLYKQVYGKNNDEVGMDDFINDFLIQNNLKQKTLPEHEVVERKDNEMLESLTRNVNAEPTPEEIKAKKAMYYQIDGVNYEVPSMFSRKYFEQMQNGEYDVEDFPALSTKDEVNYIIRPENMSEESKYKIFRRLIDTSLSQMSEETYMIAEGNPETELKESFPRLTRQADIVDYAAKKSSNEGNIPEANIKLEKMVQKVLKFYKENYTEKPNIESEKNVR